MASSTPNPPPPPVELDEMYLREWVAWGFVELWAYLAHHARFSQWCADHDQFPY